MNPTKITAPLVFDGEGRDFVLDGFDFTVHGYVKVLNANSVVIRNCRVYDLDVSASQKNYWFFMSCSHPVRVRIENCFFGDNPIGANKVYNLIEPHAELQNNSAINENYFADECCAHNAVNLYGAEENAYLSVSDNVFEVSAGTVRIGVQGEPVCEVDISRNKVLANNPNYGPEDAGLVTVQPYGKQTITFKNMTVRMDGNSCPSEQLIYGYYGSQDTALTNDNMPLIQVDGVAITAPIYH